MTVPSYTTDLTDIADADESTGWAESSVWNDGGVSMQETDYYIQGSYCVSSELKLAKSGYASIIYNYGSNLYSSFGTDYVVMAWFKFLGPNVLDTDANGGIYVTVGSGLDDFIAYDMGGSEFYRYGGWINIAADPKYDLRGQDVAVGTPASGSSFQYFGIGIKEINPISKGNPLGCDAIRYGRAISYFEFGETSDYCTFAGYAAINDANDLTDGYNRWGLIQAIAGGYLYKGLMSLGTATNLCDFRDSNVNITIDNTKKVSPTFNKIEVHNASSNIEWTGINFSSLSTVSPGIFHVIDDATVALDGCSFTDMSFFIFKSNSTIDNTVFRRCSYVNQNGATFDGCTFAESTSAVALLADDISLIDNCSFVSDGTGHAIELTTAHAGSSYAFDGNLFTGYGANGTANAAIYNNSGGAVTINVGGGGDTPTYLNGTGASTIVNQTVTLTLTGIVSGSYVVILEHDTSTPVASGAVGITEEFSYQYNYAASTYVDIQIVSETYTNLWIDNYLLQNTNASIPIQQVTDRWYNNP